MFESSITVDMSASVDEVAKEQLRTEIREEILNDWSPMEEQLRAEIREEVWRERSSMENRLRAQVREEVEDMFQIKVIDALVLEHQHAISTLLYGITPAQDKSTADPLCAGKRKQTLLKGLKPPPLINPFIGHRATLRSTSRKLLLRTHKAPMLRSRQLRNAR